MITDEVRSVSDANFQETVIDGGGLVLVDFWAPWCGPCKRLAPALVAAASELRGKATVVKVNVDENPETSERFNIRSIPTLMVFKAGHVVDVMVGTVEKKQMTRVVNTHVS